MGVLIKACLARAVDTLLYKIRGRKQELKATTACRGELNLMAWQGI
jgi:hypothetical protein